MFGDDASKARDFSTARLACKGGRSGGEEGLIPVVTLVA